MVLSALAPNVTTTRSLGNVTITEGVLPTIRCSFAADGGITRRHHAMDFLTADGRGVERQDSPLVRGNDRHDVILHELFDFLPSGTFMAKANVY